MIQRKQTLFLLMIAAVAASCLFGNPVIGFVSDGPAELKITYTNTTLIEGTSINTSVTNSYLQLSLWVILGFSFISIFLFKNRKLQAMLTGFNFIFIAVAWFFIYYYMDTAIVLESVGELKPEVQAGAFFTAVLPLLNWFALRGIIADEKLVKSMDRLR